MRSEECCAAVGAQLRGCTENTCSREVGKGCSSDAVSADDAVEQLGGKTAEVLRSCDLVSPVGGACAKAPVLAWWMLSSQVLSHYPLHDIHT